MEFPDKERVLYDRNPLEQVICQLRYPAILEIGEQSPTAFQKKIRKRYPLYQEKTEVPATALDFLGQLSGVAAGPILGTRVSPAYEFQSANHEWVFTLARDFLALTAQKYVQWEEFEAYLLEPLAAFTEIYEPSFLTRIGLRYQNVIRRLKLDLEQVPWAELLNPAISGILADPIFSADDIEGVTSLAVCKLDQHSAKVRINYSTGTDTETKEPAYVIDSDFFTEEQIGVNNVRPVLTYFNRQNRNLFRWAISDRLHEAMVPRRPTDLRRARRVPNAP